MRDEKFKQDRPPAPPPVEGLEGESTLIGFDTGGLFEGDSTLVVHQREVVKPNEGEVAVHVVDVDTVGDAAREVRAERESMTDKAWVKRVMREYEKEVRPPKGYIWKEDLLKDQEAIPPEGAREQRDQDAPPPPIYTDKERKEVSVPEHIYAGGVVWNVGKRVGKGQFGEVREITHSGSQDQPKRLVKTMAIEAGYSTETKDEIAHKEHTEQFWEFLHNEIGMMMAAGDYVTQETIFDDEGNAFIAIVMERAKGETLEKVQHKDSFKHAMALRGVLSSLRRMHAQGWIHRDIKRANIMMDSIDGEESISRPIDFGLAQKRGVIRRSESSTYVGSPSCILPEALENKNADLRIQDYWGAVLSFADSMGVLTIPKEVPSIGHVYLSLLSGEFFKGPDLSNEEEAKNFFEERNASESEQAFIMWIYNFIQPKMPKTQRLKYWEREGITKWLKVPAVEKESVQLSSDERFIDLRSGDFLDDDKFIAELEGHVLALAKEKGIENVQDILDGLQEFPEDQTTEDRIQKELN